MVFTALFLRLDLYHEPGPPPPPPLLLSYACSLVPSKAFLFLNEPLTASTHGLSPSLFTSPPSLFAPSPLNYTTLTHSEPHRAALSNARTPPAIKDLFRRVVCPSLVLCCAASLTRLRCKICHVIKLHNPKHMPIRMPSLASL